MDSGHSFSSATPSLNLSYPDSCGHHPDASFAESETSLHEPDPSLRSWCHELPLSLPQKLPKESCVYQKSESLYQSPSSLLPVSVSGSWRPRPANDGSVMEGTVSFAMSRQDHNGIQITNTTQVGLGLTSYRQFIDSIKCFLSELKQNEVETQFNAMIHFQAECRESEV